MRIELRRPGHRGALVAMLLGACTAATETPLPVEEGALALGAAPSPILNLVSVFAPVEVGLRFGDAVASAGDVNGDGLDDVIVASLTSGGRVQLFLGSPAGPGTPAWTLDFDQSGALFGYSLAAAGDVNGDGFDDIILGAPAYDNPLAGQGGAFVYHGSTSGLGTAPAWSAQSDQSAANFGTSVAGAGDVNGDGFADVVVGAPLYDNVENGEGRAYVYLGSPAGLASDPAWTGEPDDSGAKFGQRVAGGGDIDGDGYDDVLVGAPNEGGAGRAHVYFGSASGLDPTTQQILIPAGGDVLFGRAFGAALSSAGDVNGDGYHDVIVAAPEWSYSETESGWAGVYLGSATGLDASPAWSAGPPDLVGAYGTRVAAAGDVNADGYDDIAVGAPTALFPGSYTRVYLGSASGLRERQTWEHVGASRVAPAGDFDGDGADDLIIGDPDWIDTGRFHLYAGGCLGDTPDSDGDGVEDACDVCPGMDDRLSNIDDDAVCAVSVGGAAADCDDDDWDSYPGAPERCDGRDNTCSGAIPLDEGDSDRDGRLACADDPDEASPLFASAWTATSGQEGARFGHAVASAGDVNGDGFEDLIVGAPLHDGGEVDEGAAFVYLGSASGLATTPAWSVESDEAGAELGTSVASAGDVNGDGYGDVVVGAPLYDGTSVDRGTAFVYLGSPLGLETAPSWSAVGDLTDHFGFAVSGAGDVDGDGFDDVLVGAPWYQAFFTGRVYLYLGSGGGLLSDSAWEKSVQAEDYSSYGYSVGPAGDVNGDGLADVMVGDPDYELTGYGVAYGRADVYLGRALGLELSPEWTVTGRPTDELGNAVAGAGDVNADGFDDVAVGAHRYSKDPTTEGRVYVYLGSKSGVSDQAGWSAESDVYDSRFGASVAVGDVDGDGTADVLVGAPNHGVGVDRKGRAFLYLGSATGPAVDAAWIDWSDETGSSYGASVATADVNGDGLEDVAVGAPDYDDGGVDAGRVYVYSTLVTSDADGDGVPDADDKCPGADDQLYDADEDGSCALEVGGTDCDDNDPASYPGAPEVCDGRDNACAGAVPADEADTDGDGARACVDCDDADATSYPGAPEVCDGRDNACTGDLPADEGDADGDGVLTCEESTDPPTERGGCGCASGEGSASVWWAVAAAMSLRRRRSRSRT